MKTFTPEQLENLIKEVIVFNSGFEKKRNYLSISHVSGCPRRAMREYMEGFPVTEHTYEMCYAGYENERSVLEILHTVLIRNPVEVVAPFDERLKGHLDAMTTEGDVVEVKSVNQRKWEKIIKERRPLFEHFAQVQLYMRYAKRERTFLIYRNRETYEHKVLQVPYSEERARHIENKAKKILNAIDSGVLPECECGYCPKDETNILNKMIKLEGE